MRALSNLLRSLYRLTGIGAFNSLANSLYSAQRTADNAKVVKNDLNKVQEQVNQSQKNAS